MFVRNGTRHDVDDMRSLSALDVSEIKHKMLFNMFKT